MKGIIFNLFQEIITREHGERMWDDLLEATRLSGTYTTLGSYPDAEMVNLVVAASSALKMSPDRMLRSFGAKALPLLAAEYPRFFEPHRTTRAFLLTLNDIIHPEVRKLYPGADVPDFAYETPSDKTLIMAYRSPRKLCTLAEGLIDGAAAHYGEEALIQQLECMHRGDPRCVFHLTFQPRPEPVNA